VRAGFVAVLAVGAATLAGISPASAEPNCNEFFNNSDGSWSPTHPIVLASPTSQMTIGPSDRFRPGIPGVNGRIGYYLDTHCRIGAPAARSLGIPKSP
jgi:hypothetical protein